MCRPWFFFFTYTRGKALKKRGHDNNGGMTKYTGLCVCVMLSWDILLSQKNKE